MKAILVIRCWCNSLGYYNFHDVSVAGPVTRAKIDKAIEYVKTRSTEFYRDFDLHNVIRMNLQTDHDGVERGVILVIRGLYSRLCYYKFYNVFVPGPVTGGKVKIAVKDMKRRYGECCNFELDNVICLDE